MGAIMRDLVDIRTMCSPSQGDSALSLAADLVTLNALGDI